MDRAFVIAMVTLALTSCDRGTSKPPGVGMSLPEPTDPLRPQEARGEIPEDARVVDYAIDAKLDVEAHTIDGLERITFRNRSKVAISTLHFHLYMNAFSAEDTTWMRDARGSHRGNERGKETPWGYCDVQRVNLVDGPPLQMLEGDDPTVATVELPTSVSPGDTVELDVQWRTQLPEIFARTGYAGDFVMAGQWFPKVAVLEPDGTWSNHIFTASSEFYADFGNYRVILDVPGDWVVGASGIRTAESEKDDEGRKKLTYEATMVHDFAWTASPDFIEHVAQHDGIRIRQLISREFWGDGPVHLQAQIDALDSMQPRFGPYPWSTITIVHPPSVGLGAGGMEYPTLYTTTPLYEMQGMGWAVTQRVDGRFTTVHEFGHQFFQGVLASNEFAAPWLDEGMNTLSNTLVLEDAQDGGWVVQVLGQSLHVDDVLRLDARRIDGLSVIDTPADAFAQTEGLYGRTVYRKTAAAMRTLRNIVGHARFDAALATYTRRFRFRHPTPQDLFDTLAHELTDDAAKQGQVGQVRLDADIVFDVAGYLEQAFRSPAKVAFAVRSIGNREVVGTSGWHRNAEGKLEQTPPAEALDPEAVVVLQRMGEFVLPVEYEVSFEDGKPIRGWWMPTTRTHTLTFPGRRVTRAQLDPDRKLELEAARWDNHGYAGPTARGGGPERDVADITEAIALSVLGGIGP